MTAKLISPFYSAQRNPPLGYVHATIMPAANKQNRCHTPPADLFVLRRSDETEIETDTSLSRSPEAPRTIIRPAFDERGRIRVFQWLPSAFLQS